jgi:K+-sensing histidine kinase KdpD
MFALVFAVALAAWHGGWGPGLMATVLGAALSAFLFFDPKGSFPVTALAESVSISLFVVTGIGINFVAHWLRSAKRPPKM